MTIGVRVVRGPDWKWRDQDGGEGHLGTVIKVGSGSDPRSPEGTVLVQWDLGNKCNYRAGRNGCYDLLVYDSGPAGMSHQFVRCDVCSTKNIKGLRWKCDVCDDYDLCHSCYNEGKHNTSHTFLRFESNEDTRNSRGTKIGKREDCHPITVKGLFTGATVVRGPDWKWHDQDGGDGQQGKITVLDDWDKVTCRNEAKVKWQNGNKNSYRVGYNGRVDLKCVEAAEGGVYYKEHLPKLGMDNLNLKPSQSVSSELQNLIERASEKVTFSSGDKIRIGDNPLVVMLLQQGHGGWNNDMAKDLGKEATVVKVDKDGDVYVKVGSKQWCLNPKCCELVKKADKPAAPVEDDVDIDPMKAFFKLISDLGGHVAEDALISHELLTNAAEGKSEAVKSVLAKHPDKINSRAKSKTALQVAAHQGRINIVAMLLKAGADVTLEDDDGDTALHFAAYKNQDEAIKLLLAKGAPINVVNKIKRSPVMVAARNDSADCISTLLQQNCEVNLQDGNGNTALHIAIVHGYNNSIKELMKCDRINFGLTNLSDYNVLHQAAFEGNIFALTEILLKNPELIDTPNNDGFTALHIACANGNRKATEILIETGKANLESLVKKGQTPLLLAVSRGHSAIVEYLVDIGANVKAIDCDRNTCLHLALVLDDVSYSPQESQTINNILFEITKMTPHASSVALACYLIQKGAGSMLQFRNKDNLTPEQLARDAASADLLKKYEKTEEEESVECMLCSEETADMIFLPCNHKVVCHNCEASVRKKCPVCKSTITLREKKEIPKTEREMIQELITELTMLKDLKTCAVCFENNWSVAFLCGHSFCSNCASRVTECPTCRRPVENRINLFVE